MWMADVVIQQDCVRKDVITAAGVYRLWVCSENLF